MKLVMFLALLVLSITEAVKNSEKPKRSIGYDFPGAIFYSGGVGYGHGSEASHVPALPFSLAAPSTRTHEYRQVVQYVPVAVPRPVPVTTIKNVPVPQPYPVEVPRPYAVPVPVGVPYEVPKPYPVKVPQPVRVEERVHVPVEVPRPYPVEVTKHVAVEVPKTVIVKVPQAVPVAVPHPVPVEVPIAVAVKVPTPVYVKEPVYVGTYVSQDYGVAGQGISTDFNSKLLKSYGPISSEAYGYY